jgi:GT2 family glycosyltransferase
MFVAASTTREKAGWPKGASCHNVCRPAISSRTAHIALTMPSLPALDVIICTFNNATSLARTLHSLANQESPLICDWGVTVVNNCCTDNTDEVVNAFAARVPFTVRLVHESAAGLTAARRCGVRATSRQWLAFVDDDCVLAPDWVVATMAFADAHPQCGGFGGRITLAWEQTPPAYVHRLRYAWAGKQHGDTPHRRKWLPGLGMTLRRAALLATGWEAEPLLADRIGAQLVSGGDMEIALRVARTDELWYAPSCGITHLIPVRRTTRPYLRRMLHGLGASRHNVAALTWRRSGTAFLVYSLGATCMLLLHGVLSAARELPGSIERSGVRVLVSPAFGWLSAMIDFWKLPVHRRQRLLGAVAANR